MKYVHDVFDIVYHQPRSIWAPMHSPNTRPLVTLKSGHTNNNIPLRPIVILRLLLMQILKRAQETSQKRNPHHGNGNVERGSDTS